MNRKEIDREGRKKLVKEKPARALTFLTKRRKKGSLKEKLEEHEMKN